MEGPREQVDGLREQGDEGAARSKARASMCWRRQRSCWKGGSVLSRFRRSHQTRRATNSGDGALRSCSSGLYQLLLLLAEHGGKKEI